MQIILKSLIICVLVVGMVGCKKEPTKLSAEGQQKFAKLKEAVFYEMIGGFVGQKYLEGAEKGAGVRIHNGQKKKFKTSDNTTVVPLFLGKDKNNRCRAMLMVDENSVITSVLGLGNQTCYMGKKQAKTELEKKKVGILYKINMNELISENDKAFEDVSQYSVFMVTSMMDVARQAQRIQRKKKELEQDISNIEKETYEQTQKQLLDEEADLKLTIEKNAAESFKYLELPAKIQTFILQKVEGIAKGEMEAPGEDYQAALAAAVREEFPN